MVAWIGDAGLKIGAAQIGIGRFIFRNYDFGLPGAVLPQRQHFGQSESGFQARGACFFGALCGLGGGVVYVAEDDFYDLGSVLCQLLAANAGEPFVVGECDGF